MENLIQDCKDSKSSFQEDGFFVRSRKYYVLNFKGDKTFENEISNFVMSIVYHLKNGSQNTKRLIKLQRHTGEVESVEVNSSDIKPEPFETILKSNRCTFFGSSYQFKRIIAKLMDDEAEAVFIEFLGWDAKNKIYAFADKVYSNGELFEINSLGIADTNNGCYYLPAFSEQNLENEDYKKERLYKYKPGNLNFKEWSRLYHDAFKNKGAVGILYLVLSVFRDHVFNEVNFFPYLFLFGDWGTGKTSFTECLLNTFGDDTIGTPINNSTSVALSRIVGRFKNGIAYLKEFTNETDESIQDFILTVYDGSGRETGVKSNDNKTKVFPVSSGIIFDGNFLPSQKTAVLSRMILLVFEGQKFSEQQTAAYKELEKNRADGLGQVLIDILSHRENFEKSFNEAFKEVHSELRNEYGGQYAERTLKHISLMLASYRVLDSRLRFPFDFNTAKNGLLELAENQSAILKQNDSVRVFWQSVDWGISNYKLSEGRDFHIKHITEKHGELSVKIPKIYPIYVSFCRANNIRDIDQSSLKMLLFSTSNQSFIPCSQNGRSVGSWSIKNFGTAAKFKFQALEKNVLTVDTVEISLKPIRTNSPVSCN